MGTNDPHSASNGTDQHTDTDPLDTCLPRKVSSNRKITLPRPILGPEMIEPKVTVAVITNDQFRQLAVCYPLDIPEVVDLLDWNDYKRHDDRHPYSVSDHEGSLYGGSVVLSVPPTVFERNVVPVGESLNCLYSTDPPMVALADPELIEARIQIHDTLSIGITYDESGLIDHLVSDWGFDESIARDAIECERDAIDLVDHTTNKTN